MISQEQRSEAWKEARRTHIGASDAATIMGDNPYKTPYQLWKEKVLGEECVMTPAMQRGIHLEGLLRQEIEERHGCKFPPSVWESPEYPWMMASLDGMNEEQVILEIKTTSESRLFSMFKGEIFTVPDAWLWQIQHQMVVTGAQKAILYVSDGNSGFELRQTRDEGMISDLIEKERHFYFEHMMKMIPPKFGKGDWKEREDKEWIDAAAAVIIAKADLESANQAYDFAREALLALTNGESSRGGGVVATKVWTEGRVDYKSIPILEGVDLSVYRKPGAESWRIS